MNSFLLDILTPEKPFFKENVDMVVVKSPEGFMGILAHHAPFLGRLAPGPLRVKKGDMEQLFAAGAGLVEVTKTGVTVLTDSAKPEATHI